MDGWNIVIISTGTKTPIICKKINICENINAVSEIINDQWLNFQWVKLLTCRQLKLRSKRFLTPHQSVLFFNVIHVSDVSFLSVTAEPHKLCAPVINRKKCPVSIFRIKYLKLTVKLKFYLFLIPWSLFIHHMCGNQRTKSNNIFINI